MTCIDCQGLFTFRRLFLLIFCVLVTYLATHALINSSELMRGKAEVNFNSKDAGPSNSIFSKSKETFHESYCKGFIERLHNFEKDLNENDPLSDSKISQETYTIVISTYDRDLELIKNIDHWASCPLVEQVQVLWHDPIRKPPLLLEEMKLEYSCEEFIPEELKYMSKYYSFDRLNIRIQTEDLLTNRFKAPKGGFRTEGVFSIDDDAIVDCRLMEAAFRQWNILGNSSMVGFEPRQIDWTTTDQGYTWYASCEAHSCEYNTLWPTKGAFLHKSLYDRYFDNDYSITRKLVDEYTTGEDILMTYVHYSTCLKETNLPPPILTVQATSDFKREFYNYHQRYTMLEKFTLLPGYLMDLFYIDEISSLGLRSSWFRHHITESIGIMANDLLKISDNILPPMVNQWYFIQQDLTEQTSNEVCSNSQLFKSLRCTTYTSLYPVSFIDLAILTSPFIIVLFLVYSCFKFKKYSENKAEFEQIRQRKLSGADLHEYRL